MLSTKRVRSSGWADSARTLRRIGRELGRRGVASVVLVVVILGVQAFATSAPALALRRLLDAVPRRDAAAVHQMAAALVGLTILVIVLSLVSRRVAARVGYRLLSQLQVRLYEHLQRLGIAFHTRTPTGEVQAVLIETFTVLHRMIPRGVLLAMSDLLTMLAGAVVMYLLDPGIALGAYAIAPVILLCCALVARRSARVDSEKRAAMARMSTVARETLSVEGIVAVKTLGARMLTDRFRAESVIVEDRSMRTDMLARLGIAPLHLLTTVVTTIVFATWARRAIDGESTLSLGTLVVFASALAIFLNGLKGMMDRQEDLSGLLAYFREIFALLDTKVEIEPGTRELERDTPGELIFKNVSFRYAPDQPCVLTDVTLRVRQGERVAIVGASGAGKTTLGSLAVRLYDPIEGCVSIDGVDIRELTFEALHRVGYVPQSPFLFHDTIRANISLGSPDATEEQIVDAARRAQIHDWITELDDGYDTMVGTEGYRLSGGQAQRVIIARTLLADPPLLVLDEATSALDNGTQAKVEQALRQLERNRTTLIIAHRLSTVRQADSIVVLDGGRVAEVGTHDELLERDGRYAALISAEHL